jgi:ArsR family transcriptional regulator, arsenate/arsenite/antimonite-responsive transcriptional repressor
MARKKPTLDDVLRSFRQCSGLFQALGDSARQDIVLLLAANDELNVGQITEQSHLSRPAISHHLKVLKAAGLVTVRRQSRENFYALEIDAALENLSVLVEQAAVVCG